MFADYCAGEAYDELKLTMRVSLTNLTTAQVGLVANAQSVSDHTATWVDENNAEKYHAQTFSGSPIDDGDYYPRPSEIVRIGPGSSVAFVVVGFVPISKVGGHRQLLPRKGLVTIQFLLSTFDYGRRGFERAQALAPELRIVSHRLQLEPVEVAVAVPSGMRQCTPG